MRNSQKKEVNSLLEVHSLKLETRLRSDEIKSMQ